MARKTKRETERRRGGGKTGRQRNKDIGKREQ